MEVVVLVLLGTLETTVRCFNIKEGWSGWWPFPMDISGNQEQWTEFHYPELGRHKIELIAAVAISTIVLFGKTVEIASEIDSILGRVQRIQR
eukprot:690743_1